MGESRRSGLWPRFSLPEGAAHLALAEAATNWRIRATAYGALERGYDLTLVKGAHTTGALGLEAGVRPDAANLVQALDVAMT